MDLNSWFKDALKANMIHFKWTSIHIGKHRVIHWDFWHGLERTCHKRSCLTEFSWALQYQRRSSFGGWRHFDFFIKRCSEVLCRQQTLDAYALRAQQKRRRIRWLRQAISLNVGICCKVCGQAVGFGWRCMSPKRSVGSGWRHCVCVCALLLWKKKAIFSPRQLIAKGCR